MERVSGAAVADELGNGPCAAGQGVLELLEEEDRTALGDDEPVAGRVEGAGGDGGTYSPVSGSIGVPRARIWPNPANASGTSAASVPAPSIRSAWPRMIVSAASPMAWLPVAQALTTAVFGPRMPNWMATIPDGLSTSMWGIVHGDTRLAPTSQYFFAFSSRMLTPPQPEPKTIPIRSGSASSGRIWLWPLIRPPSRSASAVAAIAIWVARSWRRTSLGSISTVGSKSGTSPPTLMSWSDRSAMVTSRIPERPATRLSQAASLPMPTGDTTPSPVTMARRPVWVTACAWRASARVPASVRAASSRRARRGRGRSTRG